MHVQRGEEPIEGDLRGVVPSEAEPYPAPALMAEEDGVQEPVAGGEAVGGLQPGQSWVVGMEKGIGGPAELQEEDQAKKKARRAWLSSSNSWHVRHAQ